jgi:hypothetical protein
MKGHSTFVSLHVRSFLLVPPGRLERPRTAPEAAALSAELRGQVRAYSSTSPALWQKPPGLEAIPYDIRP